MCLISANTAHLAADKVRLGRRQMTHASRRPHTHTHQYPPHCSPCIQSLHTTLHISEQHCHQSPMNYLQLLRAKAISCCVCEFVQTRVHFANVDLWRKKKKQDGNRAGLLHASRPSRQNKCRLCKPEICFFMFPIRFGREKNKQKTLG